MRPLAYSAILVVIACSTLFIAPAPSFATEDPKELPIPADLREPITRASGIGRQLYVLDKIAAIGTDVMLENVKDPQSLGLGGYLPIQEGDDDGRPKDSFLVSFFTNEDPPRIACEVRVTPER